ncbi:hypothetical protein [Lentzea fradiae]|uniref:hypothetical protein n=1 Tax=Lentzea fradiae TaxID=200378 RepID=UPI00115F8F30|nr:hypothetical protein [Lentzea fradiae]
MTSMDARTIALLDDECVDAPSLALGIPHSAEITRACDFALGGAMREIVAVVVAAESPAGLLAGALDTLAAHLPPADGTTVCRLCSTQFWPCARFDEAARHIERRGVAVRPFVPLDLHPQLWPSVFSESASVRPRDAGAQPATSFTFEAST